MGPTFPPWLLSPVLYSLCSAYIDNADLHVDLQLLSMLQSCIRAYLKYQKAYFTFHTLFAISLAVDEPNTFYS